HSARSLALDPQQRAHGSHVHRGYHAGRGQVEDGRKPENGRGRREDADRRRMVRRRKDYEVRDPYRGEMVARAPESSLEDLDDARRAAAAMPAYERAAILRKVAQLLVERAEEREVGGSYPAALAAGRPETACLTGLCGRRPVRACQRNGEEMRR